MERKTYRILDANFNRAREALRTMEEFCRFVLDDADLSARAKQIRHHLCDQIKNLDAELLLAARDSESDVGRTLVIPQPQQRQTLTDCFLAAAKRASEALRVLAEVSRLVCPAIAGPLEQERFEIYILEKEVFCRLPAVRFRQVQLYVLIPAGENIPDSRTLELAKLCLEGGADALQLRAKEISDIRFFRLAEQFVVLCKTYNRLSIINDRADIAAAAGADGVHLGQEDLPIEKARILFSKPPLLGLTAHSESELRRAAAAGADYVSIGPCFPSPTKPNLPAAGLDYVRKALDILQSTHTAHAAIGGITFENAPLLLNAGIRTLALSSAVCSSPDPLQTCRKFKEIFPPKPAETCYLDKTDT